MNWKKAYAYLFLFFLIFSLLPLNISPTVADNPPGISILDTILIDDVADYNLLDIDADRIVDKRIYQNQVLTTGHIPFILNFEADDNITLNKGQIEKLLTHELIDIKGNRNAEFTYWILINETYMRTEKIYEWQSYEYNYSYFNNDTQLWENETRTGWIQVVVGYQDVEDYHYVWKETKNLQGHYFKKLDFVVLDVSGKFTASLDSWGMDVAPTVELLDYNNTFTEWAWWSSNWDHFTPITIASSYIDATLTDFPLLVNSTDAALIAKCDSGDSVRFVSTDNSTEFYYEIESWAVSGFNIWVNASPILSGSDTEFLMYYGNSGASDNQNPTNVWHSKYIMVQHMNDSTTSTTLDSTSNNNDGTKTGANDPIENVSGKIGNCQYFDFTAQINCTDIAATNGITTLTMSGWYFANNLDGSAYNAVINKVHDGSHKFGFHLYASSTAPTLICGAGSDAGGQATSRDECSVGNWYFFTYVFNGSGAEDGHKLHYYSNGTNVTIDNYYNTLPTAMLTSNRGFLIGEDPEESGGVYPFNGSIDETRIMSVNANASWIKADFHTQNQSLNFLTWGAEHTTTLPKSPTNFNASTYDAHVINLTWTNGVRANYTKIQNKTGSYPTSISDGTLVYNGTLAYYNHTGLINDTVYYYRAWGYNETNNEWSTTNISATNYTVIDPTVTTNASTGVEETNATLRGFLSDYGGENCLVWFEYGTLVSYGNKTTNQTMDNRSVFNDELTGLSSGIGYHYRAAANNTRSTTYGSDLTFVTQPSAPTNINVSHYNATAFNITWTKATGANRTIIRRYNGSTYPTLTTGILVYNASGTQVYDNSTTTNTEYRYSLWSWSQNGNNIYSAPTNITWGFTTFYVYNESSGLAIASWDIFISNNDGSSTYNKTGNANPLNVNTSDFPIGDPVFMEFSANYYESRYYYYTLATINNQWYNLSAYLPAENISYLYSVIIIDEYDQAIGDVYVRLKRYVSTEGAFKNVSTLYTDAIGQISIYLLPGMQYKVNMSKTGYITTEEDYITDPIYYGLGYPKYFELLFEEEEVEPDSPGEVLLFNATLHSNNTIKVIFYDKKNETTDTHFRIYEVYNNTKTLKATHTNGTNRSVRFWKAITNASRMHMIVLDINHTMLGHVHGYTIYATGIFIDRVPYTWFERQWAGVFGSWEFRYERVILIYLPAMMMLLVFGAAKHPGLGIIFMGGYISMVTWTVFLSNEQKMFALASICIVIGLITLVLHKRKKVTEDLF